jgi:signal transduction histidine kinase
MEMMKHVVELVERMVGTVEHLRVFSRDTSTETDVRFSVNEVIHSSLGLVGTQLRSHGVALTLDLTEGLPPVLGHPHQMEQVMLNLLNNARDALDEREEEANRQDAKSAKDPIETGGQRRREAESRRAGEPEKTSADSPIRRFAGSGGWEKRLWVRTRCEWNDLAWVVIEVEDNGAGIDEAHQARLFEPFFTTKPADRGTGIGLSICQAIVQRHGGWIACESRRGEGTTFRVGLPAVEG